MKFMLFCRESNSSLSANVDTLLKYNGYISLRSVWYEFQEQILTMQQLLFDVYYKL